MKIACFGDENSHTFAAARTIAKSDDNLIGYESVRQCFEAILDGKADEAVVPVENSVEGNVAETLDCLTQMTVYVCREIVMPIKQSLVCLEGAGFSDIKTVYSHYQAIGQCKRFLKERLPHAEVCAAKSTSEALKKITDKSVAAIARQAVGGTVILESGINDYTSNTTRFLVIRRSVSFEGNKCGIVFETADTPGALLEVLSEFSDSRINMTKIESRPAKTRLGKYIFFVDFMFEGQAGELTAFLAKLQVKASMLKFLGKYSEFTQAECEKG